MTLRQLCEPLFLYICTLNRSARKGGAVEHRSVRAEIESLLGALDKKAASDPALARQYNQVSNALVFFVDSIIGQSRLPFASEWRRDRLAHKLGGVDPGDPAGDGKFFDILDETLRDRSDAATERLAVLYTCMGLGFAGSLAGDPAALRGKMAECAMRLRKLMDVDDTVRMCPQAYASLDDRDFVAPAAPRFGAVAIVLVVLLLLVFTVKLFVFGSTTKELDEALQDITHPPVALHPSPAGKAPA